MNLLATKQAHLNALEEMARRISRRKIDLYFRDTGKYSRDKYPKHIAFFNAGAEYRQRLMLAANRIGKTESVGLYEAVAHLTGQYPHWWRGKRFDRANSWWLAGDTKQTVREILQRKLLGENLNEAGTGVLPGDTIYRIIRSHGVADTVESVVIRHVSGGLSDLTFKSYDQGRKSFQGTEKDGILLDEEPPLDVYTECLARTMTNSGIILATFTPLSGMSDTVMLFLPGGKLEETNVAAGRYVITATWDDVPHLSEAVKAEMYEAIPPYQRDARSKGIPQLGAGAIYQVPESEIVVNDFELPDYWPRAYGLDVGWNRTAAIWGARDPETGVTYLYSEYYQGHKEPSLHVEGIRARGEWVPGVIDPAARGRGQRDGTQLLQQYRDLGLNLTEADNGVESGIYDVWQALSTGKLKVFKSLGNWLSEFRLYRRDDKGHIVKKDDHLMDATRYLKRSGMNIAQVKPAGDARIVVRERFTHTGWMG